MKAFRGNIQYCATVTSIGCYSGPIGACIFNSLISNVKCYSIFFNISLAIAAAILTF